MSKEPFGRGGWLPSPEDAMRTPILARDGLVSFDGEIGPWMRILSPAQVKEATNPYRSQA